eukprot:TRINITY_DN12336_c0_g2_i1.p1 TRINITY_DN12336_c0_g2~~TRINITY_DN12336_c0_g2_i1.p1  ORF type:complete len:386 (-),score=28.44 TRINITY_DN12336_c0_g2_i1:229-1350(-)
MGNSCARRRSTCCKSQRVSFLSEHELIMQTEEKKKVDNVDTSSPESAPAIKGFSKSLYFPSEVGCCGACPQRARAQYAKRVGSHKRARQRPEVHNVAPQVSLPLCAKVARNPCQLTESQLCSLQELKGKAVQHLGSLSPCLVNVAETEEQMMLRFLRARKFDVQDAFEMLKSDVEWRRARGVDALARKTEQDVLRARPEIPTFMPWKTLGCDRQGRPIVAKHLGGKCDFVSLLKTCPLEELITYHIWQQETCCQLLSGQSQLLGLSVEQWVVIVDTSGWHLGLATHQAIEFLRCIASIDSAHYPERLAFCVFVNTPPAIALIWKVVRTWLTKRQQSKFKFCSSRKQAADALLPHVDARVLPADLGGLGPPLQF